MFFFNLQTDNHFKYDYMQKLITLLQTRRNSEDKTSNQTNPHFYDEQV